MEWMKKHTDTVLVLGSIVTSVLWMNSQFNDLKKDISNLDKEIAIVKTVLIMKGILPTELVSTHMDTPPQNN